MRGTGRLAGEFLRSYGITPARAGNSQYSPLYFHPPWDHPRACGEQARELLARLKDGESPPRVRGTGGDGHHPDHPAGITPARAGNRFPLLPAGIVAWDHPRACGEQLLMTMLNSGQTGSPPRVRGTGIL